MDKKIPMKKKRILCLIGQLWNGGTERQLYLFLKHLDRECYDAAVLVSGKADGRWVEPISALGYEISELGGKRKLAKFADFRRTVGIFNPDIIFSWSFFTNAFSIASYGIPFIGTLRGDLFTAKEQLGFLHWKLSLRPKTFIVNSASLKSQLISAGKK